MGTSHSPTTIHPVPPRTQTIPYTLHAANPLPVPRKGRRRRRRSDPGTSWCSRIDLARWDAVERAHGGRWLEHVYWNAEAEEQFA
jgi:hypothetical protein